jgi:hypothetical protein
MADCLILKKNLGLSKCNLLPSLIKGMITTPRGFSITAANALLTAQWQNALLTSPATRIYFWPLFKEFKDNSEKTIYEENELASLKVRDGKFRFQFAIKESLCLHKAMQTHGGNATGRAFLIDVENNIIGTSNDNGATFIGLDLELLNPEKLVFSDGKVSTKSPLYVVLSDNKELDVNGMIVASVPLSATLNRLTDVTVAQVGNLAATIVQATVKVSCDGTSVDGLVAGDFSIKTAAGVVHAITTCAQDPVTGIYSLTSAAAVVGDILSIVGPAALSIQAYEAGNTVVIA